MFKYDHIISHVPLLSYHLHLTAAVQYLVFSSSFKTADRKNLQVAVSIVCLIEKPDLKPKQSVLKWHHGVKTPTVDFDIKFFLELLLLEHLYFAFNIL